MSAQKSAFAIGVLPDICAFHRYTGNSDFLYRTRAHRFGIRPEVEPPVSRSRLVRRLRALYAQ